uniref:TPM domain-containing protein n=1 Tax=Parerythrobacter lutipelagi TaxID=1964208 RepID=UPI0010F9FF7F|nr:TPM domain-containing protein [Parerythrobacter lutipelagi]
MARYLDEKSHAIVSDAVREAELHTSGEIVTVLADRSDGYSDIVLAWCALASFTVMSVFAVWPDVLVEKVDGLFGGWGTQWTTAEIVTLVLSLGVLTFGLMWLLLQSDRLRFLSIPGPVKSARARQAAIKHFKVGAERRTHGRTGVLLYLSMQEHRAEIIADESITEKVEADVWGEAMADMLVEIRQGEIGQGLAAGVRDVGAVLSQHFPRAGEDENELPDRLIEV